MDWYYAVGTERKGPISEADLRALILSAGITPDTLVWNRTFTGWMSAEKAGLFSGTAVAANERVCIITGRPYPTSHMIETEHGWVSAEGREIYYQCLRENVPFPNELSNARADGKRIVVPLTGARFPLRCVKTNEPVGSTELKKKTLWWCTPVIIVAIVFSFLIGLILYIIFRKSVKLEIPISRAGRSRVMKQALQATAVGVGGAVMIGLGIGGVGNAAAAIFFGVLLLLVALIWGSWCSTILRVTKISGGYAWLAGAHPDFVAALPRYSR